MALPRSTNAKSPLISTRPDLVAELVNPEDAGYRLSSSSKIDWRCKNQHVYRARISNRVRVSDGSRSKGSGCPYCSHYRAMPGETDLATTHPELAAQLADKDLATTLLAGSAKKVQWRCQLGHVWTATVTQRTHGSKCPTCLGRPQRPSVTTPLVQEDVLPDAYDIEQEVIAAIRQRSFDSDVDSEF